MYQLWPKIRVFVDVSVRVNKRHILHQFHILASNCGLTSSSGTPNLRSSCLAFFRESLLRSASVPVTVFLAGCGSLSSWKTTADQRFHPLYLHKMEQEVAYICFRQSDLLLSGLVGHFDIGETLSTACRVSHTCDLQQAFPLHGRNKGSGCVPRSCPHLECVRQHQCGVNLRSFISELKSGKLCSVIIMKNMDEYFIINLHLKVLFILLLWCKEGFLTVSSILKG